MKILYKAFLFSLLVVLPCSLFSQNIPQVKSQFLFFDDVIEHSQKKLHQTLDEIRYNSSMHPSHTNRESGMWEEAYMRRSEWTSGFFAGTLWHMYRITGEDFWKELATDWTEDLESAAKFNFDHDTGFRVMNSYGVGYLITSKRPYFRVLTTGAQTLSTRFSPAVGAIKSWDPWHGLDATYPVIIDNLMNLELLFYTALELNNNHLYDIAYRHAETSLEHHMRPDGSTYHIVDFNEYGEVNSKFTRQGYGPNSVWARGQAWAVYGFTMTYRFTRDQRFLEAAEAAANYFIDNLPEDFVPYYDFLEPVSSVRTKDASAAAITASALFELYSHTSNSEYFNSAVNILNALSSEDYLSIHSKDSSILRQSTLHRGQGNVGTSYADYYFLEAIIRYRELTQQLFPQIAVSHTFYLEQNFPNPFNSSTRIFYSIEEYLVVEITLYDASGRKIRTLRHEPHAPGTYSLDINASGLSTGVYFYSVTAGNQRQLRKMVHIK